MTINNKTTFKELKKLVGSTKELAKLPTAKELRNSNEEILDEYEWSRNHCKAVTIRRWKRDLKKKARAHNRRVMHQAMQGEAD